MPWATARERAERFPVEAVSSAELRASEAIGQIVAESVVAHSNAPPEDRSAMDGFAIRWSDLRGDVETLSIVRGDLPVEHLAEHGAVEISTGSPVPPGADTVVPHESTRVEGDRVRVRSDLSRGQNVLARGSDYRAGTTLVTAGSALRPYHLGLLAAEGVARIAVRRPCVAVVAFATRDVDGRRGPLMDTITPTIASLLPFCRVELIGTRPGDADGVRTTVTEAAARCDLLVTVGGASVGTEDAVKPTLRTIAEPLFEGVAANVLKRVGLYRLGPTPVLVLPGQPVSALVGLHAFGLPILGRMTGASLATVRTAPLAAAIDVRHRMDTTFLFRFDDRLRLVALRWGVAFQSELPHAEAFGVLDHGRTYEAGEPVEVQRLLG